MLLHELFDTLYYLRTRTKMFRASAGPWSYANQGLPTAPVQARPGDRNLFSEPRSLALSTNDRRKRNFPRSTLQVECTRSQQCSHRGSRNYQERWAVAYPDDNTIIILSKALTPTEQVGRSRMLLHTNNTEYYVHRNVNGSGNRSPMQWRRLCK